MTIYVCNSDGMPGFCVADLIVRIGWRNNTFSTVHNIENHLGRSNTHVKREGKEKLL